GKVVKFLFFDLVLKFHHFAKLMKEPRIDLGKPMYFIDRVPDLKRISYIGKTLRIRPREFLLKLMVGNVLQTKRLYGLKRAKPFEKRFLERAADGHHLADRF